jgi:hypothetical protein
MWQPVWADEFTSNSLASHWNLETVDTVGNGWGNEELQSYTADAASVADGWLTIRSSLLPNGTYTSARA